MNIFTSINDLPTITYKTNPTMKFIKPILAIIVFSIAYLGYAQEKVKVNYSKDQIQNSQVVLSEHWNLDIVDNNIRLFNGSIKNNSNKTLRKLELDMYLIDDSKTDASSFTGIHMGNLTFNVLRSKSQIAGLNIVSETKQDFNLSGNYKPIVVVSDKDGKILDIQYVELSIFYSQGKPRVQRPEKELAANNTIKNLGITDLNKMKLVEDNSVVLDGEWKIEIDFKNFLVKMKGGDIANKVDQAQEDVAFEVFLTDQKLNKITEDFNGVKIASSKLGKPIDKKTTFFDTEITTNIIQIPQPGSYYIMVTILTPDTENDGDWVVRSKRTFPNSVSL